MSISPADAVRLLSDELIRKSPNGCCAFFVTLTPEWGIKCFRNEASRDKSWENQRAASEFDLAPMVGDKFNFGKYYCMVCEVAQTLYPQQNVNDLQWSEYLEIQNMHRDEIGELRAELENKIGFSFYDDNIGNVGYLNGKMVCIDME